MGSIMDLPTEGIIMNNNEYLETIKVVSEVEGQFKKAHDTDAGYDILAYMDGAIKPNSSLLISTGLQVAIPKGYVGIIKSRSGLSVKSGIDVGAGVIDCGYTGEVKVLLRNTSDKWFDYSKGDKIAQMVVVPICPFQVLNVKSLGKSARGAGGFNSTGK